MFFTQIFDSTFSQSATFFFYPLVYIGVEMGTKSEKSAKKSEVFPIDTTHFANQTLQYNPTTQFRRKLTGRNHSILMGVPSSSLSWRLSSHLGAKMLQKRMQKSRGVSSRWSTHDERHILLEKKRFSRAHVTRGRVPWDLRFFCFHNLHTRVLKRGFFRQKKGKSDFHSNPLSSNCIQLSKTWEEAHKTSDIFQKTSEKKEKRWTFSKKTPTFFLVPFCEGCESKKCKIPGMRARVRGTDEKRKLYAVIATNNESFVRQICRR